MTDHLAGIVTEPPGDGQFPTSAHGRLRHFIKLMFVVGLGTCFAGVFLIISSQSIAIAAVVFTIVLGLACWPIANYFPGTIEKGLLFALAFTLTISLKKHLIFRTDHLGGAVGLRMSITDILLVLLLAVLAFRFKTNRKVRIEVETPILLAFSAYFCLAMLSAALGNDPQLGLFELSALVQAFLLFVFLRNYLNEHRRFKVFVAGLLAGLMLQSAVAIVQSRRPGLLNLGFLGAGEQETDALVDGEIALPDVDLGTTMLNGQIQERPTGLLIHPNVLAIYLVLVMPVAMATLIVLDRSWLQAIAGVALTLSVPALYLTLSRSGWAGLAVAVVLAAAFWRLWKPFRLSIHKRIALGLIVVALTGGVAMKAETIAERWSDSFKQAVSFRTSLASTSWSMVKAHPFLGVGLNSFVTVVEQYDQTKMSRIKAFPVHNILLLEFSETGMLGGLAFLVLWIVAIRFMFAAARRSTSPFPRVVSLFTSCGIVGFFLADMTGFTYRIPIITSLVWTQVAIALCAAQAVPSLAANRIEVNDEFKRRSDRGQ
jgi:putative inorganic carbon (HCO3(-)) transporter